MKGEGGGQGEGQQGAAATATAARCCSPLSACTRPGEVEGGGKRGEGGKGRGAWWTEGMEGGRGEGKEGRGEGGGRERPPSPCPYTHPPLAPILSRGWVQVEGGLSGGKGGGGM